MLGRQDRGLQSDLPVGRRRVVPVSAEKKLKDLVELPPASFETRQRFINRELSWLKFI